MVRVSIQEGAAVFDVQGLHKLLAFKSRLKIPLAHIKKVRIDPDIAKTLWKGVKMPGTHVPGIIAAGTFYKGGKRLFWDVRDKQNAIVVELVCGQSIFKEAASSDELARPARRLMNFSSYLYADLTRVELESIRTTS